MVSKPRKPPVLGTQLLLKVGFWDFPGPAVMTLLYNARGTGLIPGQVAKIPHASWQKKKGGGGHVKQKQYCNKFNKDIRLKNGVAVRLKLEALAECLPMKSSEHPDTIPTPPPPAPSIREKNDGSGQL